MRHVRRRRLYYVQSNGRENPLAYRFERIISVDNIRNDRLHLNSELNPTRVSWRRAVGRRRKWFRRRNTDLHVKRRGIDRRRLAFDRRQDETFRTVGRFRLPDGRCVYFSRFAAEREIVFVAKTNAPRLSSVSRRSCHDDTPLTRRRTPYAVAA